MLEVVRLKLGFSDLVRDPLGIWIRLTQPIQALLEFS